MPVLAMVKVCQGALGGGSWVPVLNDASLDVERGEIVAVVGRRLSGKTTLLKIAAGIATPESGQVQLGARDLTKLPERERVRLRGRELIWLNRTGMEQRLQVSKIVGWPLALHRGRRETELRAGQMLERVGALDCAQERWADLSPWQQLLVGFAQAFAGNPEVVVIDDLLDALGTSATKAAAVLLRSLIAETEPRCGVLMSTCDRDSAVFADRTWSLEHGGGLTPTGGHHHTHADVLPLRRRAEGGGSRRMG